MRDDVWMILEHSSNWLLIAWVYWDEMKRINKLSYCDLVCLEKVLEKKSKKEMIERKSSRKVSSFVFMKVFVKRRWENDMKILSQT